MNIHTNQCNFWTVPWGRDHDILQMLSQTFLWGSSSWVIHSEALLSPRSYNFGMTEAGTPMKVVPWAVFLSALILSFKMYFQGRWGFSLQERFMDLAGSAFVGRFLLPWDVSGLFQISYEIVPWSLKWAFGKEVFGNVLLWPWMHPLHSGPQGNPVLLWLGESPGPVVGSFMEAIGPGSPRPVWSPDVYT